MIVLVVHELVSEIDYHDMCFYVSVVGSAVFSQCGTSRQVESQQVCT